MRQVFDGYWKCPPFGFQNNARCQVFLQSTSVKCGRHDDYQKVRPVFFLDIQGTGQSDVPIKVPLVKLIKDYGIDSAEVRVVHELAKQNSFGFEFDAGGV